MSKEFTLEDLEKLSGLPMRTLRFYIQEGLLPGPDTRGKFARYSQEHLDYLLLIQRLKDIHLPLHQIKQLLDSMSPEDMLQALNNQEGLSPFFPTTVNRAETPSQEKKAGSTALEYIQNIQNTRNELGVAEPRQNLNTSPTFPYVDASQAPQNISSPITDAGSWKRVILTEQVELMVREPMDRDKEQLVDEIRMAVRKYARTITKKGEIKK